MQSNPEKQAPDQKDETDQGAQTHAKTLKLGRAMKEAFILRIMGRMAKRYAGGKRVAYVKGDVRPLPHVAANGELRAPRVITAEDQELGRNEFQATGPKLRWKAPRLVGLDNPAIKKDSKNKYGIYHSLREAWYD